MRRALAVVALLAVGCTADPQAPTSAGRQPSSTPPSGQVWLTEAGLHVGRRIVAELPPGSTGSVNWGRAMALTVVRTGAAYRWVSGGCSTEGRVIWHGWSGAQRELTHTAVHGPSGDHDGAVIAWVERRSGATYAVAFDTAAQTEIGQARVPGDGRDGRLGCEAPGDRRLLEVAPDRLLLRLGDYYTSRLWEWRFQETDFTRLPRTTSLVDRASGVTAHEGPMAVDRRTDAAALTRLRFCSGSCVRAADGRLFPEGSLSPDGRWFAAATGYDRGFRLVVLDTRTGRERNLAARRPHLLPGMMPYSWSFDGTLQLHSVVSWERPVVVRHLACDLPRGRCDVLGRHRMSDKDWPRLPS